MVSETYSHALTNGDGKPIPNKSLAYLMWILYAGAPFTNRDKLNHSWDYSMDK